MPQTREHLAIVQLLGVARGHRRAHQVATSWSASGSTLVTRDVAALLAGTLARGRADRRVLRRDRTGPGGAARAIDRELARAGRTAPTDGPARLPVDRVVHRRGLRHGGDRTLWRGPLRDRRCARAAARAAARARAPRPGARRDGRDGARRPAHRGRAPRRRPRALDARRLARRAPGSLRAVAVLDVRFELLPDCPRPWPAPRADPLPPRRGEIIGRLVLLEGDALAPGESALAQLRLERPPWRRARRPLRDPHATRPRAPSAAAP